MNEFLSEDQLKGRHDEEKQHLHKELTDKDAALREYRKEHGKLEVFFNRVISHIKPIEPLDSVFAKLYRRTNEVSDTPITPVLQGTDWHMGAVQEPDEIEYFNSFNPNICDARIVGCTQGFIDWCLLHRGAYNIKDAQLIYTGDLISGDIHEELRVTNAFPVTEQVVRAAQLVVKQIALIAPYFERVKVDFLTEDNHGRLTKKPQAKEAGINNFNYLVARMVEAYIKDIKNIEFNIHTMHEKVIHVSTLNYLLTHGHGITMTLGVPWYGIERRIGREAVARQSLIMEDVRRAKEIGFNKVIHGHFHVNFDSFLYSCGGSASGTDAYDHQSGRFAPPMQIAWMVHPKWGEFNRIPFNLTRYDEAEKG